MKHSPPWLLLGLAALALAAFPLLGQAFYVELLAKVMIFAIFAMSLQLLAGVAGLVSLGHAAWFGIAAYTLVLMAPKYHPANLWITLPAAVLAAAAAAFVVGLLVLRTRGIYFIMVTLAFAQMFYFVFHDTGLGGGSDGVYLNFKPEARIAGHLLFDLGNSTHFFYVSLGAMVAVFLLLTAIRRSPFGHALDGMRANEQRMRALGFPVMRYQLAAFTLAGGLAGLAGYLAACQFGFVNPELLAWHESGNVLLMVILGGLGQLHGAILGAFAFALLQEGFASVTRHWQLPMGVVIVALVLFLPGGLASIAARLRRPRS